MIIKIKIVYCIARNIGCRKHWQIDLNLPKFCLSKFYCSYNVFKVCDSVNLALKVSKLEFLNQRYVDF